MSDAAALVSAARHTQNTSDGIIKPKGFSMRTCPFVSRPCQMVPSALFFHLSQTIEGGATYPSRTPWPPATSGCRKSWLWWSHSGRSSWWRGRWRSVSSPCHLPHLPSSTVLCSALQLEVHSASGIPPDGGWHSARRNPAQQWGEKKSLL